jgi:hypothetical protein
LSQLQQEDEGDFVNRCIPKTYSFFLHSKLAKSSKAEGLDKFDYFIRTEVPMLQFLSDQYYAQGRKPELSLSCLCEDPVLMDQLDDSILNYLRNRKRLSNLVKLRNTYIILLENALIRNIKASKSYKNLG